MAARRTTRRPRRSPGRRATVLVGVGCLLGGLAAGWWLSGLRHQRTVGGPAEKGGSRPAEEAPAESRPAVTPRAAPPPYPAGRGARLALVIDDLGRDVSDVERLVELGAPVSFSVLPYESQTSSVVRELHRRGLEVLCHLPMDPGEDADPGPGAVMLEMSRGQIAASVGRALQAVPGAVGVNNHMGSRLTPSAGAMDAVMEVLAQRGVFFLDSRTSSLSKGYEAARRAGLATGYRDVFLDGDPSPEAIRGQIRELADRARSRGSAIAIGHPHPGTLEVLRAEIPRLRAAGYEFVPVSYLLDRAESLPG